MQLETWSKFHNNLSHDINISNLKDKDNEIKENEARGVSMATPDLPAERRQPQMSDDAAMNRNVCYATTQHAHAHGDCGQ